MHLASSIDAVQAAWNAYDAAQLKLHDMYSRPTVYTREERMQLAGEVTMLWRKFMSLYDAPEPGATS